MKKSISYNIFEGRALHSGKYDNNIPLHIIPVRHFINCVVELVAMTDKQDIFEVGCGEGQILGVLYQQGYKCSGLDYDEKAVSLSRQNFEQNNMNIPVSRGDVYNCEDLPNGKMLICLEVLEHLEKPEEALRILSEKTDEYLLVSVPREPLWCILNFIRGKYRKDLGNTPGHIKHWSKKKFIQLCKNYGEIVAIRAPLPWTIVLLRKDRK